MSAVRRGWAWRRVLWLGLAVVAGPVGAAPGKAWLGTSWQSGHGTAGLVPASARLGAERVGKAGHGSRGVARRRRASRGPVGMGAAVVARRGEPSLGADGCGRARQSRRGGSRSAMARPGVAVTARSGEAEWASPGPARLGAAWQSGLGLARRVGSRHHWVWLVRARQLGRCAVRRVGATRGAVGQSRLVSARHGAAWLRVAGQSGHGWHPRGVAWRCPVWLGAAWLGKTSVLMRMALTHRTCASG